MLSVGVRGSSDPGGHAGPPLLNVAGHCSLWGIGMAVPVISGSRGCLRYPPLCLARVPSELAAVLGASAHAWPGEGRALAPRPLSPGGGGIGWVFDASCVIFNVFNVYAVYIYIYICKTYCVIYIIQAAGRCGYYRGRPGGGRPRPPPVGGNLGSLDPSEESVGYCRAFWKGGALVELGWAEPQAGP